MKSFHMENFSYQTLEQFLSLVPNLFASGDVSKAQDRGSACPRVYTRSMPRADHGNGDDNLLLGPVFTAFQGIEAVVVTHSEK
jgi:hypothetical protein